MLSKRPTHVLVRYARRLEVAHVHVRVLLVDAVSVLRTAHHAARRSREALTPQQRFLASEEGINALGDAPPAVVEEAIVLGVAPVARIDPRVHENLSVERLRLLATGGAQGEGGDQMATR